MKTKKQLKKMLKAERKNIERLEREMPGKVRALDVAESRYYLLLEILKR